MSLHSGRKEVGAGMGGHEDAKDTEYKDLGRADFTLCFAHVPMYILTLYYSDC